MTYTQFRTLRNNAISCTDLSDYIHQNITLVQGEFKENSTRLLKAIWELAYDFTPACLFRVCGRSQSSVSKDYHIPLRTVQAWATGEKKPLEYNVNFLSADMLTETFSV